MMEANPAARLVLVDEDQCHARALRKIAFKHGFETFRVAVDDPSIALSASLPNAQLGIVSTTNAPGQIARLRNAAPTMPIVAIGESHEVDDVLRCIRAGATDYLHGTLDSQGLTKRLNEHFSSCTRLMSAAGRAGQANTFGIVGASREMRSVRSLIARMSQSEVTTLIEGPTGSGKEVVALALHHNSPRADKPLVALNCAALPDDLIEGELFGYERGAFSGATTAYPGKLALADGGTLFLDEIGELSAAGQAKLLRAIEARQCYRLGGLTPHTFDVRVIAATNRNLAEEVARGNFRSDLYYRIAVAQVPLTGLAQRKSDIVPLAQHFLSNLLRDKPTDPPAISSDALLTLEQYNWPGNARELRNAMEVALLSGSERGSILPCDLSPAIAAYRPVDEPALQPCSATNISVLTPSAITSALDACAGNKSAAARALGCSRMTLYRHLQADPALAKTGSV